MFFNQKPKPHHPVIKTILTGTSEIGRMLIVKVDNVDIGIITQAAESYIMAHVDGTTAKHDSMDSAYRALMEHAKVRWF